MISTGESPLVRQSRIDQFSDAYTIGLVGFIEAIEEADPRDPDVFKSILYFATQRFGVQASGLAQRVGHSQSTICKWLGSDAMPRQSTREIVIDYILTTVRKELVRLQPAQ